MKIAIVNNGVNTPQNILDLVKNYESEVFDRENIEALDLALFDMLILSGSNQLTIEKNRDILEPEMELIRKSSILTLGICYGCELMAVAFGGSLKNMGADSKESKPIRIKSVKDTPLFAGKKELLVYDAHRWTIDLLPPSFEVLAESDHGIEIIKHTSRPLYGFQFHPEKMPQETDGPLLFENLLKTHGISRES